MIRDALLAGGVAMSYASQIDVPGFPFGVGELCLLIWILLSLARILAGERVEVTPALALLAVFWAVFAIALSLATFVGYFTTMLSRSGATHDAMAYGLLMLVTCLAAAEPDSHRRLRRCAWWVVGIGNVALAIQIAQLWGWIPRAGVDPWFWDRFRGWSGNPNQIALYCAAFGPLALHLATTTDRKFARILGLLGMILPFYVGRLTKSDTFLYASVLTWLMLLGLQLRAWLAVGPARVSPARQLALVLVIAALPLALTLVPFGRQHLGEVEQFAKSLTKDQGGQATAETAEMRLRFWNESIELGLASASLGLGPGPHLRRSKINDTATLPNPFEAHNTILDLYTQGGLLAVGALVWLVLTAASLAWRASLYALLALLASLVVFGLPHLIIRHPIVWFAVTLALVAGARPRPVSATLREG
jgi:hypothetical protein